MTSSNDGDGLLEAALVDILTQIDNGEAPDPEAFLAKYPECAIELRKFFSDLKVVDTEIALREAATHAPFHMCSEVDGRTSVTTKSDILLPDSDLPHIAGFNILEELGGGSQGVVYKAKQVGTKRIVALKVIREGAFASKLERVRFESEVELASRLNHPNIVSIYAYGRDSGRDYFAMEYVEGETLDIYASSRTLELRASLELFEQICDAVSFAHQRGVIHRDLKPANVIVDLSSRPHIVDFGLAKQIPDAPSAVAPGITHVGEFAGTWTYASPEQVRRDPAFVDVRSDVYSLGVILYELLTDTSPYPTEDESRETIAKHILGTAPTRPSSIRRDIDHEIEAIILRALHKDPDRRYQSGSALRDDIRHYLAGEVIEAKLDSSWYVFRKTLERHRWRIASAATLVVALVAFAVTVSILYSKAVAARATNEVRAQVVRNSQTYLADKLDELNWTSNRLIEIAEAHPTLPQVQRTWKEAYEDPLPFFDTALVDMPERIYESIRPSDADVYARTVEWLRDHERELARIEDRTRTSHFVFGLQGSRDSGLAFYDRPSAVGTAVQICDALIARALHSHHNEDHEAAAANLDAARSIALDLSDVRLLHGKVRSVTIRTRTYDALLTILNDAGREHNIPRAYVEWALRDPSLARYRLAMMTERLRLSQLFEGAAFGKSPGGSGYLDLDVLNGLADGFYGQIGALTDQSRALARSITPSEALAAIDEFMQDVEQWDLLSFGELDNRADQLVSTLRRDRAWGLVSVLLTNYKVAFRIKGRVRAKRAAVILAARLCNHRDVHGRWPETLDDPILRAAQVDTTDPYMGRAFGYKLLGDRPVLYSVNEDGQDNGGRHGQWGDPGTDVVLFRPQAP